MKTILTTRALCALSLPALLLHALTGCDGDDAVTPVTRADAGMPFDASVPDAVGPDARTDASMEAGRAPAMFLPTAEYSALLSLDPAFPFGVTQVHKAAGAVEPAGWGAHGGPVITEDVFAPAPKVTRYNLPSDVRADAMQASSVALPAPGGLPAQAFFSYLGVADVSTTRLLYSYTGAGATSPGELFLLDNALAVKSRAKVNGVFDQKVWTRGSDTFIAYTGLSGLSASASTTSDNGLYLAQFCSDALLPTGACKPSFPLLKWAGFSGPVVTDSSGNMFVAASVLSKPDAIYALSNSEVAGAIGATSTLTKMPLAEGAMGGSSAFAAVAPEATGEGWIVYRGGDFMASDVATKAIAYRASASGVQKTTEVPAAIVKGPTATDLYYFTDTEGDLWIAVSTATSGAFVELRRK
jgi:hypothetical protein